MNTTSSLFIRTIVIVLICIFITEVKAQVSLRDTTLVWRHHRFELNDDYGMQSFSTSDSDVQEVTFTTGKVIENELIKLVLLPEYGGRVLSFVYKPTGHEYLYQSECGSAYGIGDGNFYYDWLMVYGGIFPTFPEAEHGKTWLQPWTFSVKEASDEKVSVRMQNTDSTQFNGAPGQFNNGITDITCSIDITVYQNQSRWDFDVTLTNNQPRSVNYEYWTCTTLAPGSEIGHTGTPLTSEIVAPSDQYRAGWSPGGWIGGNGSTHDFADINVLDEWSDMGIAYAESLTSNYWGVINHDNEEGIFRISDNVATPGMKLWTWGRNNVDNDMYDFSNGGADNYIELWAGTSRSFFEDATLTRGEVKSWKEIYCPTVGISAIDTINEHAVLHLAWNEQEQSIDYELNTFDASASLRLLVTLDGDTDLINEVLTFNPLGHTASLAMDPSDVDFGTHEVEVKLLDASGEVLMTSSESFELAQPLALEEQDRMTIASMQHQQLRLDFKERGYQLEIVNIQGQTVYSSKSLGTTADISLPGSGLYVLILHGRDFAERRKVLVQR